MSTLLILRVPRASIVDLRDSRAQGDMQVGVRFMPAPCPYLMNHEAGGVETDVKRGDNCQKDG